MDYQDYPPPLTCKGCSFEPLEPPLLRAWFVCLFFGGFFCPALKTDVLSYIGSMTYSTEPSTPTWIFFSVFFFGESFIESVSFFAF